jgi:hypothetical protein
MRNRVTGRRGSTDPGPPSSEWLSPLLDEELTTRRVIVEKRHVVFVRGVFEASEGLGAVFATPRSLRESNDCASGALTVAVPLSRREEMDRVLADLRDELGENFCIEP